MIAERSVPLVPRQLDERPPDPHAPLRAGDTQGALVALLLVVAGGVCGVGYLHPFLWPLAWLGVVLTALGLRLPIGRAWLIAGLLAGGLAQQWAGHPWYHEVSSRMFHGYTLAAEVASLLMVFPVIVLPARLPLVIGALLARGRRVPVCLWLPVAWWAGEWLNDHWSGLSQGDWLYSQWQVVPVLRAVGHLGWTPALLLCLTIAAAAGDAVYTRSIRLVLVAAAALVGLLLLPPLPGGIPPAFTGVAAVHMRNYFHPPRAAPPGVTLLIWPEVVRAGRPRLREGPGNGRKLHPPFPSNATSHILGLETRAGLYLQNSVLALAPDGRVAGLRAKRRLFPVLERRFLGMRMGKVYLPGQAQPYLDVAGRRVATLVCFESLDRSLALAGPAAGAQLLAISAIDGALGTPDLEINQVIADHIFGITVLRAVETGLPVVRASLHGPAAFITPDGRVLAQSRPGTDGVLTLQRDYLVPGGLHK